MTRLSVNLNKVALIRNQRDLPYPDLLKTAETVLKAGAHGITVHPRPDERHIQQDDIPVLSSFLVEYKAPFPSFMMAAEQVKDIEFNIEGYPDEKFLSLVTTNHCHQVTLVPDAPNQKTSDHGWDIAAKRGLLKDVVLRLKDSGRRVSLFIDAKPEQAIAAKDVGADRIELYTGPYAMTPSLLTDYIETAKTARECGLGLNAGHDLNLDNLARFIAAIPDCEEVSIGHAITSDALMMGWNAAVSAYLSAISYGQKTKSAA